MATPKTKPESESTEVTTVNQGVLAPAFLGEDDFGMNGFENADGDSYAIPFLQILQKMSPMVDEDDPKHVEGAKAGMVFNTVTQAMYDGKAGVLLVPCFYKRSIILWGGREGSDSGFKGEFTLEQFEELKQDQSKCVLHEGRYYIPDAEGKVNEKKCAYYADTRSHFVIVIDPVTGEWSQAILSLASSQIRASKTLMTLLNQKKVQTAKGLQTPPTFANVVRMTTTPMTNEKGSWSAAKFELESLVTDANLFAVAKEFYNSIKQGQVGADYSKADAQTAQADVSSKPQDAEGF